MPEIGGGARDRFHHVAEHGVVGLDLFLARPASDQLGLLVQSGVGDVRDVSQRLERGAGRFLVPQIDRQKVNVRPLGSSGLRRETPTTSQPAERNVSIAATPSRPLAPVTSTLFGMTPIFYLVVAHCQTLF